MGVQKQPGAGVSRGEAFGAARESSAPARVALPAAGRRDPNLEDVEANRVGERVKVVPRGQLGHDGRVPTNLRFESQT